MFFSGATEVPEEVRAKSFILLDLGGEPCAMLSLTPEGSALTIYGENDKLRTELAGSQLFFCDEKGSHAVFGVMPEGPGLELYDASERVVFRAP